MAAKMTTAEVLRKAVSEAERLMPSALVESRATLEALGDYLSPHEVDRNLRIAELAIFEFILGRVIDGLRHELTDDVRLIAWPEVIERASGGARH